MHKKTKWKIKHQGSWYPLINVVDSGKPSHEEGGGNRYHVEGHDPIHQDDIEDIDMGYGSKDVSKADKIPGGVRVEYTAGFALDKVPTSICQLIESIAAINILSTLGPILFTNTSISISIDGASQSTSNFGPKYLNDRIDQLKEERDRMIDVARGYYQRRFLISEL